MPALFHFKKKLYFCGSDETEKLMSKEEFNVLQYAVALVSEFASHYHISQRQALNYLVRFKGFQHLEEFYDVLHTFSFEDSIESLSMVCRNNGGRL